MLVKTIRQIRKGRGHSQERMARALAVSVRTIVRWESGETSPGPRHSKLLWATRNKRVLKRT